MHSEDELRSVTIGELHQHNAPILLADYDPAWPQHFEAQARSIRAALGDAALTIEHVGSTSVPGLAAKPSIDVMLVVRDSSDEAAYVSPLEAAGYILRIREPEWHEHRLFKDHADSIKVHVFSQGCSEIERMLAFRDRLRGNPADRIAYENHKRELAAREWQYVQHYADAKSEFIEKLLARLAPG
ncbi:MAG TPA: GrpB family protein [Candidatus Baltobacteraceae bacterium]|jgi:GrpB-like predicted nucleotidyltransferase (UPF0157 family)